MDILKETTTYKCNKVTQCTRLSLFSAGYGKGPIHVSIYMGEKYLRKRVIICLQRWIVWWVGKVDQRHGSKDCVWGNHDVALQIQQKWCLCQLVLISLHNLPLCLSLSLCHRL